VKTITFIVYFVKTGSNGYQKIWYLPKTGPNVSTWWPINLGYNAFILISDLKASLILLYFFFIETNQMFIIHNDMHVKDQMVIVI